MRVIKFRAWDKSDKVMYKNIPFEDMIKMEIMQFTGLQDKTGRDIYGGDIMQDDKFRTFRVYSVDGGFVIKADYWMRDLSDLIPSDQLIYEPLANSQNSQWVSQCEIIGNIYENQNNNVKNGQMVTILDNCDYRKKVKGMQGIIVGVKDYGVEVYLNVFPTLSYQDNIFFFPLTAIK